MDAVANEAHPYPGRQYTLRMRCRACPGTSHVIVAMPEAAVTARQLDSAVRHVCQSLPFFCTRCEHERGTLTAYFPTK